MTSVPIRDPLADHLITPQNAALIVIDYQQNQFRSVRSMDSALLLENVFSTAKLAKLFGLPIVHSTVGVAAGQDQSTLPVLADLLEDYPPIDRTTINSWEDADFLAAVRATGRRKLILCARGRDRSRNCRDRLHRPPVDGMCRQSVLMERSRTDHTRDPLCPVCSRPIKNNATAIQLSGLRL
jgi:Isochorismatase family